MRHAMRRWPTLPMIGVLLAALSGCGLLGGNGTASAPDADGVEKAKIRVALLPTVDLAPFRLARAAGYFDDEGIQVEEFMAASGQAAMTKMIGGEVDIAFSSYLPFLIAKSLAAVDIRIVAGSSAASPRSTSVVSVPNSPVKTVRDLAGKRIGITDKNTASHLITVSLMQDHGVDVKNVKWVSLPFPKIAAALAAKDIDAAFLAEPFLTQASTVVGAYPIVDVSTGSTQDIPLTGFAAMGDFVTGQPKSVAAFQRALARAAREVLDRTRIEPLLAEFTKTDRNTIALTSLPAFESSMDVLRLQRVADLLLRSGVIPARLDMEPMLVK